MSSGTLNNPHDSLPPSNTLQRFDSARSTLSFSQFEEQSTSTNRCYCVDPENLGCVQKMYQYLWMSSAKVKSLFIL